MSNLCCLHCQKSIPSDFKLLVPSVALCQTCSRSDGPYASMLALFLPATAAPASSALGSYTESVPAVSSSALPTASLTRTGMSPTVLAAGARTEIKALSAVNWASTVLDHGSSSSVWAAPASGRSTALPHSLPIRVPAVTVGVNVDDELLRSLRLYGVPVPETALCAAATATSTAQTLPKQPHPTTCEVPGVVTAPGLTSLSPSVSQVSLHPSYRPLTTSSAIVESERRGHDQGHGQGHGQGYDQGFGLGYGHRESATEAWSNQALIDLVMQLLREHGTRVFCCYNVHSLAPVCPFLFISCDKTLC
jgi:hypothetical protein